MKMIAPESQASQTRILQRAFEIADRRARELEALARAEEGRAQAVESQVRGAEMRWASYKNDRITRQGQAIRAQRSATEKLEAIAAKIAKAEEAVDVASTPKAWGEAQRAVIDLELQAAVVQADADKAAAQLDHGQAQEDLHTLFMGRLQEALGPARETAGPARLAANEARARADGISAEIERIQAESDAMELAQAERLALGQGIGPRAEA